MTDATNKDDIAEDVGYQIRDLVCDGVHNVMITEAFKSLTAQDQLHAVFGGLASGIISVAFSSVEPTARRNIVKIIKRCIDEMAEQSKDEDFTSTVQ